MSDSKLLDRITLYVQIVCSTCLVQNLWMESPCMFNLSVLHVWFKTFRWIHPVCSTCQFFMSGSKFLDGITLYVQIFYSSCLVQNFWIETPCIFSFSSSCLVQNLWIESPGMFNLSVLHVWLKIWMELPCIFNLSVLHVWFKTWMESPCMFFMSGSKLLDGIFLYVQFVSTSCLVQNI
jgi:hypothetical protein